MTLGHEQQTRDVGGAEAMRACALCETTITAENDSDEHLIPNALGGRRKASGFLCRACATAGRATRGTQPSRISSCPSACWWTWRGSAASRQA
jgi:HNH endonuclease